MTFNRITIIFAALLACTAIANALASANDSQDPISVPSFAGGPCAYDEYQGQCKICSITKTNESIDQEKVIGGPGYAGFEVKYDFFPVQPLPPEIQDRVNQSVLGCKNILQLVNSWYPGPKFLQKYNITEGATFNCNLSIIKSGTCTPEIIEFRDIDLRDYFESST